MSSVPSDPDPPAPEPSAAFGRFESAARQVADPVWQQVNDGESRWPVTIVVLAAVVMQLRLPASVAVRPFWLLPVIEIVIALGLVVANPRRIDTFQRRVRIGTIVLVGLMTLANAWSAIQLVRHLILGDAGTPTVLLGTGAAIWATNVIAFSLWYWELDRGGPGRRAEGTTAPPDFLFPQMSDPALAAPGWTPAFVDYLYVSFTNATAFSPTDVMPMARWAKLVMMLQSAVSLITVGLVVARAVNVLK